MSLDPAPCKHRALAGSNPGLLKLWAKLWCNIFNAKTLKLKRVLEVNLIFSYLAKLASGPFTADQLSTVSLSMKQPNFGNAACVVIDWRQPPALTLLPHCPIPRVWITGATGSHPAQPPYPRISPAVIWPAPKPTRGSCRSPQQQQGYADSACSALGFCGKKHSNTCKYCKCWCFTPTLRVIKL